MLCLPGVARAETLTLEWDPNPTHENIAGYIVSFGSVSRMANDFRGYGVHVDVGQATSHRFEVPPKGLLYMAIRAYDELGVKSEFSEEIVLFGSGVHKIDRGTSEHEAGPHSTPPSEARGTKGYRGPPAKGDKRADKNSSETERSDRRIAELERQLNALLLTCTRKHPDVRALQRQLDRLRREAGFAP
jgi:hypothetical protein